MTGSVRCRNSPHVRGIFRARRRGAEECLSSPRPGGRDGIRLESGGAPRVIVGDRSHFWVTGLFPSSSAAVPSRPLAKAYGGDRECRERSRNSQDRSGLRETERREDQSDRDKSECADHSADHGSLQQ